MVIVREANVVYCTKCNKVKRLIFKKDEIDGTLYCECGIRLRRGLLTVSKECSTGAALHDPYIHTFVKVGETGLLRQQTCEALGCGAALTVVNDFKPFNPAPQDQKRAKR